MIHTMLRLFSIWLYRRNIYGKKKWVAVDQYSSLLPYCSTGSRGGGVFTVLFFFPSSTFYVLAWCEKWWPTTYPLQGGILTVLLLPRKTKKRRHREDATPWGSGGGGPWARGLTVRGPGLGWWLEAYPRPCNSRINLGRILEQKNNN